MTMKTLSRIALAASLLASAPAFAQVNAPADYKGPKEILNVGPFDPAAKGSQAFIDFAKELVQRFKQV